MINRNKERLVTVGECYTQFITEKQRKQLSNASLECSNGTYHLFIKDLNIDEKQPISVIDSKTVDRWVDFLLDERHNRVTSVNAYLGHLRVFLYWCMKQGYIPEFKVSLLKHQEEMIKYYTDDELNIMVKKPQGNCSYSEYRTWVIICFILATGARASTICNIKIDDIDFKNKEVTYRHLKNKQTAILPLSNDLVNILLMYMNEWNLGDNYLFCSVSGHQLTVSALRQGLDKYCRKRGIKSHGPHALRHSFARSWIKNGGGAFQLQKMLNHSDITMTQRYVRLFSDDLHEDIKLYSPLDSIRQNKSRTATIRRI